MNYYLLCWSTEGFETIMDVTSSHPDEHEIHCATAILSGDPAPKNMANRIASNLELLARYNPQRFYECYIIGADEDLEEMLWEWAETDPQSLANFAREKHFYKVFDHRSKRPQQIV